MWRSIMLLLSVVSVYRKPVNDSQSKTHTHTHKHATPHQCSVCAGSLFKPELCLCDDPIRPPMCIPEMQIRAAAMEPATAAGSLFTFPSYAFPFHLLPSIVKEKNKKNMAQLEGRSLHTTLCCKHSKISANLYEEISKSSNLDVKQVPKVSTEWCSHVPGGADVCVAVLERTAVTPSSAFVDTCVCASVSVCVSWPCSVSDLQSFCSSVEVWVHSWSADVQQWVRHHERPHLTPIGSGCSGPARAVTSSQRC